MFTETNIQQILHIRQQESEKVNSEVEVAS
jgi:hypothetical protein